MKDCQFGNTRGAYNHVSSVYELQERRELGGVISYQSPGLGPDRTPSLDQQPREETLLDSVF